MLDSSKSRRSFIFTSMGLLSAAMLFSPKVLRIIKPKIKDILGQMELEILTSSNPKQNPSVICHTSEKAAVLYRKSRNGRDSLCSMNVVGKVIWDACDGMKSPNEISSLIHERYLVSKHRAWLDTLTFLALLKEIGAIL